MRNWKKEFLGKAASAFDDSKDENIRQKLAQECKEKEEHARKVGQLTMQVDWLKKNLKKFLDLNTRVNLVKDLLISNELLVSTGASLLGIKRSSVYYAKSGVSQDELDCKAEIDKIHTENPAWGSRQITKQLKRRNFKIVRRKARRYMQEMCINAIFPGPNLSRRLQYAKVVPYLLRNAVIISPNQTWSIDITYIALRHGFIYLTAIITQLFKKTVYSFLPISVSTKREICSPVIGVCFPHL